MNDDLICDEEVESAHQIKRNVSSREDIIYKSKYFNFEPSTYTSLLFDVQRTKKEARKEARLREKHRERLWNRPITDNEANKAYIKQFGEHMLAQCKTCTNHISSMHFYALRLKPDLLALVCKTCASDNNKGACQRFLMGHNRCRTWIFRNGPSTVAQCDICNDPQTLHIFLDRLVFHAAHDKAESRGGTAANVNNMHIGHVGCNRYQHTLRMREIREKHLGPDTTPPPFFPQHKAEVLTRLLRASKFDERAFDGALHSKCIPKPEGAMGLQWKRAPAKSRSEEAAPCLESQHMYQTGFNCA